MAIGIFHYFNALIVLIVNENMFPPSPVNYSIYTHLNLNGMLASPIFIKMLNVCGFSLFCWKLLNVILIVYYNNLVRLMIEINIPTCQRIGMMHKSGAPNVPNDRCQQKQEH